jgi:hypothetical protein
LQGKAQTVHGIALKKLLEVTKFENLKKENLQKRNTLLQVVF